MSGNDGSHAMSKEDAARIQSTQAKAGHDTGKGTFAARAQAAGDKVANILAENEAQSKAGNNGNAGAGNAQQK